MTLKQDAIPLSSKAGFAMRADTARAFGVAVAYLLLGALTLSPLLWVHIPPLVDYPVHLARMSVLLHDGDGSAIATNYVAHWHLLPNLGMDLVVPVLAQLMPLGPPTHIEQPNAWHFVRSPGVQLTSGQKLAPMSRGCMPRSLGVVPASGPGHNA